MNKQTPNWVINKRKYNNERSKAIGYKGFSVRITVEQFDSANKLLKERNLTRQQFIEKIIEKYK